ncbi:MAG: hypothetical protein MjAS7_0009 [Metallosphaera javensis (ex Sakai et al. 2022)]|nr:MAG: hypothetical protein MjAS7_0009 [Metallosphaera javensis (ex Sakai et al. 2022)]
MDVHVMLPYALGPRKFRDESVKLYTEYKTRLFNFKRHG